jgi:hypothetical protein
MSDSAPRPWRRFRLRTLFVVFTVACAAAAWLGWNIRLVGQRNMARESIVANGGWVATSEAGKSPSVSVVRRLLGDEPVEHIVFPHDTPPDDVALACEPFPELSRISFALAAD